MKSYKIIEGSRIEYDNNNKNITVALGHSLKKIANIEDIQINIVEIDNDYHYNVEHPDIGRIMIGTNETEVSNITIFSQNFETKSGIHVQSTVTEMLKEYGQPRISHYGYAIRADYPAQKINFGLREGCETIEFIEIYKKNRTMSREEKVTFLNQPT